MSSEFSHFERIEVLPDQKAEQAQGKPVYLKAHYEGGAKCWNGPSRSMTVSLVCGNEDELMDVEEPSPCEYTAVMKTPAACFP